ncbi:magnesium-dependent phosphatase-1 [Cokeromyces recurvatus]|uniref:magnesium-dependent phosphatase-1 n=1 Tax=Cokeromyces recurvatus TaxID=90255 RepID=UPI00221E4BCE|nr:magnesium-dependent phosphatase-1 [Cokeromyces recurvatus]KAI7903973.1 magnesium-dependent phosphatase-1 [Cokeromyces recurvatus]
MTKGQLKKVPSVLPKMIVFDLDYTLWPEWIDCTYGPPYTYDKVANEIHNEQGESLRLFEHTASIISLIKALPDVKIGIASRTQTPDWARKALRLLRIPELDNTTLYENIDYFEIYPGSKMTHFQSLSKKSGIACHNMLFFDDESRNREVTRLGVHFVKVDGRTGITPFQFENALHAFANNSGVVQSKMDKYLKKI